MKSCGARGGGGRGECNSWQSFKTNFPAVIKIPQTLQITLKVIPACLVCTSDIIAQSKTGQSRVRGRERGEEKGQFAARTVSTDIIRSRETEIERVAGWGRSRLPLRAASVHPRVGREGDGVLIEQRKDPTFLPLMFFRRRPRCLG